MIYINPNEMAQNTRGSSLEMTVAIVSFRLGKNKPFMKSSTTMVDRLFRPLDTVLKFSREKVT